MHYWLHELKLTKQMYFVNDDERDFLHIAPGLPRPRDAVPLFGSGDDDTARLNGSDIWRHVTGQFHDLFLQLLFNSHLPVRNPLSDQRLQGGNVNHLAVRLFPEHPEHCNFCSNGFSRAGGGTQEHIVVTVVQGVEQLGLDGVEVSEGIQHLKPRVFEGRHRKGVQVQQRGVRGMPVREDEVLEPNGRDSFTGHPLVTDGLHEVLGGQGLLQWDGEHQLLGSI